MLAGQQESAFAQQLIAAYRQLIARARLHGIKVLLGTLVPFGNAVEGLPLRTFCSPTKEGKRKGVNEWIRNFSEADAVADLDQALAEPGNPSMLLPTFDCGNHVHRIRRDRVHLGPSFAGRVHVVLMPYVFAPISVSS